MEPLGVLLGAVLGGAGLSGAVASVVQLGRATRATRAIDQIKKSGDGREGDVGGPALALALERERVKLASLTLVSLPRAFAFLVWLGVAAFIAAAVVLVIGIIVGDVQAPALKISDAWALGIAAFFVVGVTLGSLDTLVQNRRGRFVDAVLLEDVDVDEARQRYGLPDSVPTAGDLFRQWRTLRSRRKEQSDR
jgi:low affinity Fe/Cu permease